MEMFTRCRMGFDKGRGQYKIDRPFLFEKRISVDRFVSLDERTLPIVRNASVVQFALQPITSHVARGNHFFRIITFFESSRFSFQILHCQKGSGSRKKVRPPPALASVSLIFISHYFFQDPPSLYSEQNNLIPIPGSSGCCCEIDALNCKLIAAC
jgi:hypothetical protein